MAAKVNEMAVLALAQHGECLVNCATLAMLGPAGTRRGALGPAYPDSESGDVI